MRSQRADKKDAHQASLFKIVLKGLNVERLEFDVRRGVGLSLGLNQDEAGPLWSAGGRTIGAVATPAPARLLL